MNIAQTEYFAKTLSTNGNEIYAVHQNGKVKFYNNYEADSKVREHRQKGIMTTGRSFDTSKEGFIVYTSIPVNENGYPIDMPIMDDHLPSSNEKEEFNHTLEELEICGFHINENMARTWPELKDENLKVSFRIKNGKLIGALFGFATHRKEAEANAARIVKSWNCHDDLYNALKECREWYEKTGFELCSPNTPLCFSKALSALQKC